MFISKAVGTDIALRNVAHTFCKFMILVNSVSIPVVYVAKSARGRFKYVYEL